MKPEELQGLMKGIGIVIRDQLAPVFARMDALEKVQPLKGDKGDSVDVEQVRLMVAGEVKNIPPAKNGEDGIVDWLEVQALVNKAVANVPVPKDGKDAEPVDYERIISEVTKHIPVPKDGQSVDFMRVVAEVKDLIPKPKDGDPGKDAEPVNYDLIIEEAVKRMPVPKDGQSVEFDAVVDAVFKRMPVLNQPKDGENGDSVTLDEVRPFIEAELSKWALDFERRAQGVLERAVDKIPAPKPGKDGIDGFTPDDFDVEHKDGGRVIAYKLKTKDREIIKECRTAMTIYRGVYSKSAEYQLGDSVTYGGSSWTAERDNPAVPGDPDSGWRLSVKRGNDAK